MIRKPPVTTIAQHPLPAARGALRPRSRAIIIWDRRHAGNVLEGVLVVGLILFDIALMLPALSRFPPVTNDEGREANLFWVASGSEPGAARITAYRGSATWGNGGLQGATAALIFRLLGLGVFQARLTSLLWGGLLLLVVYWLGRWYWGRAAGLAAMALLAVSEPFLLSTHTLRPDIQVATLVLLALALVEHGLARGRAWPCLLAGLLLGLAFDTHMNALAYLPLVAAPSLLRDGRRAWRRPAIRLLAAGLALAAVYYVAVRVIPDPQSYFAAFRYWVGIDKAPPLMRPGAGGLPGLAAAELERYREYFGVTEAGIEEWPELLLVLFGIGLSARRAWRGARPDRVLLLGLIAAAIFFVVAVSMKSRYYMILSYPVYVLLIARGCQQLASRIGGPLVSHLVLAALVSAAVVWPLKLEARALDKYVRAARYKAGQDYAVLTAHLAELAGPGARILAPPLYWIGLHDHPFVDIFVYERVRRQYGETASTFLCNVRPDLVITDGQIATEKNVERELYRALDQLAPHEPIGRHKNYGDLAIYRLTWPPDGEAPACGSADAPIGRGDTTPPTATSQAQP